MKIIKLFTHTSMKILLTAALMLFTMIVIATFCGCAGRPCDAPKKPFIITSKHCKGELFSPNIYRYEYIDANGTTTSFEDDINKYSVGDTL